ncbi:Lysine-specific demethylase 2A [Homalodisca vitripennis]|nr:Lysine-specific demethylase 2A [Homalodisca vitripennis]
MRILLISDIRHNLLLDLMVYRIQHKKPFISQDISFSQQNCLNIQKQYNSFLVDFALATHIATVSSIYPQRRVTAPILSAITCSLSTPPFYAFDFRDRKERKLYSDDWTLGDEDIEGRRAFSLQEKLESKKFPQCFAKEMQGSDLTLAYLQRHGFNTPLLFKEKTGLGLQVPSQNFTVNDVRVCVGSRRQLDVMDVNTQKNFEMSMKEWQRYYEEENKDRLLNVISLEFSHTKLENFVQTPSIVRQIDWVDCVWPKHLKDMQVESTNAIDDMMYPKVQKYCLMSVKGCYTDFHIDFGGTSVWYHILKGSKVFWLIPPNEHNITLYEQWVLSGKQGDVFFGDTVERCGRVTLTEGNTFFIPTGWIHAVYTPKDSLVFGGNFLHSYCIDKQLRIAQVEDTTHVPQKFRYPFFTEMLWYVLERYVYFLLGNTHLYDAQPNPAYPNPEHIHLTPQELQGIKAIVGYLHSLPQNKKNVPDLIKDPIALIKDVRTLVEQHRHDNHQLASTGRPILLSMADKRKLPYFGGSLVANQITQFKTSLTRHLKCYD